MKSKFVSLAIVAILFAAAIFLLSGCVTVPIPPFGESRGELGNLEVAVSVKYIPVQNPDIPGDSGMKHAWQQFGLAKALKDK